MSFVLLVGVWSLKLRDFQLFLKRLRKKYTPTNPHQHGTPAHKTHHHDHAIRFYHCGEYGDLHGRPHYHACLFNHHFDDLQLLKVVNEIPLYRSPSLEKLWPHGHSSIGDVTFQSAAYIARYIMKKRNGEDAENHYDAKDEAGNYITDSDGVILRRLPEYTTMSRRPGIGSNWLTKFYTDVYPDDFIIIQGKKCRPPKFYDTRYELTHEKEIKTLKIKRKQNARKHSENNTPARLRVREKIQQLKTRKLVRTLEQPK